MNDTEGIGSVEDEEQRPEVDGDNEKGQYG